MGITARKIRLNVKFGQWDAYEDWGAATTALPNSAS